MFKKFKIKLKNKASKKFLIIDRFFFIDLNINYVFNIIECNDRIDGK